MRRRARGVVVVYILLVVVLALLSLSLASASDDGGEQRKEDATSREQQRDQLEKKNTAQLNGFLNKMKPSFTHTGDGLPSLHLTHKDAASGEPAILLHPATILNGKHVGFSKKRILEEIGRKEMEKDQFFGRELAREGFDSLSVFGAENVMKRIESDEDDGEKEGRGKRAKKRFTMLEFVDAGKKRATREGDAAEEEVSLIDEEDEDDILGGARVAVFNVDMSSDAGKYFENTGMFSKIKELVDSQKKNRKKQEALHMSVNEMLELMRNQLKEKLEDKISFLTSNSGGESDKHFRVEDARKYRRNRGKKVASIEEIRKSNRDRNMKFKSGQGRESVHAKFYNALESHVELAWLDFDGKEVKYADLAPGASTTLSTFTKHKWLAKNHIGDPICFFVVDDRSPTMKNQYFEISEEEDEEVPLVMEEEDEESSEAYIRRKEHNRKLLLANAPQTPGNELTQEEREELLRVAREQIQQFLANEKSEDVNIEVESVHVFESTQDIVDFFEKRAADKSTSSTEEGESEEPNVVWLSEDQFHALGKPENAEIKPPLDAVDALVEEELLEEEAVRDVLRAKKTEEMRGGGEEEDDDETENGREARVRDEL
jgi:hypothetical protein